MDISKDTGGTGNIKQSNKSAFNKTIKNYTYWWKCGEFGHLAKECNKTSMSMNQSNGVQNQSASNSVENA